MEIKFIKTQSIENLVKLGMGKVVFDTLKSNQSIYISDSNLELFKDASIKYAEKVDGNEAKKSHNNVKYRRLAKEYYYYYEELTKMCHNRKDREYENNIYSSSDGYRLDYNTPFAKKITNIMNGY